MLSGKPPRPWKRSRRRGLSVARIALHVLLLGGVGVVAAWYWRPLAMPWLPVGSERIATPAFDIADAPTRRAMNTIRAQAAGWGGDWLGAACAAETSSDTETYVLIVEPGAHAVDGLRQRIAVRLGNSGEIVRETATVGSRRSRTLQRRSFGPVEADAFRDLLVEADFTRSSASELSPTCMGGTTVTLESCVAGRYFGIARECVVPGSDRPIAVLAARIEAFALDADDTPE